MNLLLDTSALIESVDGPERLPEPVARLLADTAQYPLGVSAISAWEVAWLAASGRMRLSQSSAEWLRTALRPPFIRMLPLTAEVACEAAALPAELGDPADRIIAATARVHGLTLVTANPKLLAYPHLRVMWE